MARSSRSRLAASPRPMVRVFALAMRAKMRAAGKGFSQQPGLAGAAGASGVSGVVLVWRNRRGRLVEEMAGMVMVVVATGCGVVVECWRNEFSELKCSAGTDGRRVGDGRCSGC